MQLQSLIPPAALDVWLTTADEQRYAAMVGVLAGTKHPTTEKCGLLRLLLSFDFAFTHAKCGRHFLLRFECGRS